MSPTLLSRRAALQGAAKALGLVGGATLLAACGGGGSGAAPAAAPTANANAPEVKLNLSTKAGTPYFDNEKLEAAAGSRISLTFKNAAEAGSNRLFNWVLVKPGKMLIVVSAGQSDGNEGTDYVKPNDENVIAHTKLVQPGQSETISFAAPEPGEYPYICTFPGLYTTMKGTLTVK